MFLANWANSWATLFPSCLVHSILTHCKFQTKWWISPITFPSKEKSSCRVEIAFMTEELSPSMTSSEKPASTSGPFATMTTITSPFSFQITTPKPELLRAENKATSKLSLKIEGGGGCQMSWEACSPCNGPISTEAVWNSSRNFVAWLFNQPGSWSL